MAAHITPLTRSQLLELEGLFAKLVCTLRPPSNAHRSVASFRRASSVGSESGNGSSTRSSPSCAPASGRPFPLDPDAIAVADGRELEEGQGTLSSSPLVVADHPSLHGFFFDVFEDPLTRHSWRLYDKILYLVWWSYRPNACSECGMTGAWMPSGICELKCAQCGSEAGSTRVNDYVDDIGGVDDDDDDGGDGEDGGGLTGGGGGELGGNAEGSDEAGAGAVAAYVFFYEWLQHIPLLRFGGEHGGAGRSAGGEGAPGGSARGVRSAAGPQSSANRSGAVSSSFTAAATSSASRSTRGGGTSAAAPTSAAGAFSRPAPPTAAGEVALPVAEELAMVLRAAYDLSSVLVLPGMAARGLSTGVRAAALYLSLLLHRYAVPFPLFCLARRGIQESGALSASKRKSATATTAAPPAAPGDATQGRLEHSADVQWVDIELYAALLGVSLTDFFDSPVVASQYLQNVMTVAAQLGGVPSLLWHPTRLPQRMSEMMALVADRRPLAVVSEDERPSYGLSPEHTAMIVALEVARQVDAHPIAACSTSTAAAAQNAVRLGQWLDSLGVYPKRCVYRPASDFKDHAAFVASLTSTAAVAEVEGMVRGTAGAPSGSRCARDALVVPGSPFESHFEVLLLSPCANTLLHIFAHVCGVTALQLCDLAARSGLYKGPTRFLTVLRAHAEAGDYSDMPLFHRLTPLSSPWMSVYMALHSPDRLATLSVLRLLNDVQNDARDRALLLSRLLQRILRRYHATSTYQFNYILQVQDGAEPHFKGLYYLSRVSAQEGLVTFTCLRSGRKTLTFNRHSGGVSLCYVSAKEKSVAHLAHTELVGPVIATIEGEATRLVVSAVVGSVELFDAWGTVVRHLDLMGRIRRRMRVPMLASRLDALASIREAAAASRARHTVISAATLAGWGATESLLAAPPLVEPLSLRAELQHQLYSLPSAAFLFGLSENRIVGMYAAQVALLEFVEEQIQQHYASGPQMQKVHESGRSTDSEDDHEAGQPQQPPRRSSPNAFKGRGGAGTSPPHRRRRQRSRGPRSSGVSPPPLAKRVTEADGRGAVRDGEKRRRDDSSSSESTTTSDDAGDKRRGTASEVIGVPRFRASQTRTSSVSSDSSSSMRKRSSSRSSTDSEADDERHRVRPGDAAASPQTGTAPLPPCWVEELLATEAPGDLPHLGTGFDDAALDLDALAPFAVAAAATVGGGRSPEGPTASNGSAVPRIRERMSPTGPGPATSSPPLPRRSIGGGGGGGRLSVPPPPPPPRAQHAVMTPILGPSTASATGVSGVTLTKRSLSASPPPPLPVGDVAGTNDDEAPPPLPPLTLSESVVPLPLADDDDAAAAAAAAARSHQARAVARELHVRRQVLAHLQHALPTWSHVLFGHGSVAAYFEALQDMAYRAEMASERAHNEVQGRHCGRLSGAGGGGGGPARRRRREGGEGGESLSSASLPASEASVSLVRTAVTLMAVSGSSDRPELICFAAPPAGSDGNASSSGVSRHPTLCGAALASSAFSMFDADACRRQLHNLYVFLHKYGTLKRRLYVLARQGTLPDVPVKARVQGRRRGGEPRTSSRVPSGPSSPATRLGSAEGAFLRAHGSAPPPVAPTSVASKAVKPPSPEVRSRAPAGGSPTSFKRGRPSTASPHPSTSSASSFSSPSRSASRSSASSGDEAGDEEGTIDIKDPPQPPTSSKGVDDAQARMKSKKSGRRRRRLEKRQEHQKQPKPSQRLSPQQSPSGNTVVSGKHRNAEDEEAMGNLS